MNQLRIVVKCRLWFSRCGVRPEILHSIERPLRLVLLVLHLHVEQRELKWFGVCKAVWCCSLGSLAGGLEISSKLIPAPALQTGRLQAKRLTCLRCPGANTWPQHVGF